MKIARRLIAYFLALTLIIGAMPTSVLAADDPAVDNGIASVDNGNLSVEGSNGFGNLLSEEITEQQEAVAEGASCGYTVTDLEIEGNVATVTYDSLEEATLVVALYTEDGLQMLLSGSTTVLPEETTATVTLEGEMPEYFQASAYLLDSYDWSPLCPAYDTPLYTKEMQELLASTVDDYEADRVLNLDEDRTTNFAVYADTTKVIDFVEGINLVTAVDHENAVYVFENADEQITALSKGDIVVYPYSDTDLLIVKVASVTIEGGCVRMTGDDVTPEEVFSHIKIDSSVETADTVIDASTADEGVTYTGMSGSQPRARSADGAVSAEAKVNMDFNKEQIGIFSFKGSIEATAKGSFEYYFTSSYKRIEFKVEYGSKVTFEVRASGQTQPLELKLVTFTFPIVTGIDLKIVPTLVAELSVNVSGELSTLGTVGFGWSWDKHGVDFLNLCEAPKAEIEAKLVGKVYIGFKLVPKIEVIDGEIIMAEMASEIGFEVTGALLQASTDVEEIHDCTQCIDGNVSAKLKLKPTVQLLSSKKLSFSADLADFKWDLFDFYICDQHGEKGLGSCPRKSFRVTVTVVDQEGQPITGAQVKTESGHLLGTTNGNGVLIAYLSAGDHKLFSYVNDSLGSKDIHVYRACAVRIVDGVLEKYVPVEDWESMLDMGHIRDSGSCGTDAGWTLYSSGILRITGRGSVTSYTGWDRYDDDITRLIIADGITEVCDYAFKDCENLEFVRIPGSLTRIGDYGFTSCHNLKSLDLPSSVQRIGSNAFQNCVSITELTIPDSVTNIGSYAFQACTGLTELTIGSGVTGIGAYAFNNCSGLTTVDIPEGVSYLREGVFGGCAKLENVYLPDSLTEIYADAFYGCGSLKTITIPRTVKKIGNSAFAYSGLTEINIPEGVTRIGDKVFHYCNGLTRVSISDTVTHIGKEAFFCCSALTDVKIGSGITKIGKSGFYGCEKIEKVSINDIGNWCAVTLADAYASPLRYGARLYSNDQPVSELVIPEGVENISSGAFKGCSGVTGVTFPSSLTAIGEGLFSDCTDLKTVRIAQGVTSIGKDAFYCCAGLTSIHIPQSVTTIGASAFKGCSGLAAVTIAGNATQIGAYAFEECTGLKTLTFGEGVSKIGYGAFSHCTALERLEIPDSVTGIGESAFVGCTGLTDVSIGHGVTMIPTNVFYECSNLKNVTLSDGITGIGSGAFESCGGLQEIRLPERLTVIGERAFFLCESLTEITIPAGVTDIGAEAFCYCGKLTAVTFAGNAPSMDEYAFYGVGATAYYPAGNETWTADVMRNYSGKLIWTPYTPAAVSATADAAQTMQFHATRAEGVFGGSYTTQKTDAYTLKTAAFTGLVPGGRYVLLSLAAVDVEELLGADNLLYIDQGVAGEDGTLTFRYVQCRDTNQAYVMVCGASDKDLKDAVITFPEMATNGETQSVSPSVTYQGTLLTEGRDYVLLGAVDYTDSGDYVCYVRGVHRYTGLVRCEYRVVSGGVTVSGKVASFGEADAVTVTLLRDGTELRSVTADSEGLYSVGEVAPGIYTLCISKKNHITRTYTVTVAEANVTVDATICLIGDVNTDGKVNMKDWIRLYDHISEVSPLSGYALQCADVTADSKINMKDWLRIYDHLSETAPLW